jgi:hypothetical protein
MISCFATSLAEGMGYDNKILSIPIASDAALMSYTQQITIRSLPIDDPKSI